MSQYERFGVLLGEEEMDFWSEDLLVPETFRIFEVKTHGGYESWYWWGKSIYPEIGWVAAESGGGDSDPGDYEFHLASKEAARELILKWIRVEEDRFVQAEAAIAQVQKA